MKKEQILILCSNFGDGHLQAAQAILEATRLHKPHVETAVFDFMKWTHPFIHSIGRYVFIQGVKQFPSFYSYLYHKTHDINSFSLILKKLNFFGIRRMLKLLQEIQPSVVVSTFPLAAGTMSVLKSDGLTKVPTVTIITDHTDHSYWIYPNTDQYIVGSNLVRQGLKRFDIADSQIAVTGIPIRPEFCKSYHRHFLKEKYGFHPTLPIVLWMGGGCGLIGDRLSTLRTLESLSQQMQLIIVCGHNNKLRQQLTEGTKHSKHRILLTGYINYVHELMAFSDILITKPGGLTTSEAIALELPMLLYQSLPGQEQDNARFLLEAGVAMQAENITDLITKLSEALHDPKLLSTMKENARQLQTKWAAFDALKVIRNIRS